LTVEGYSQVNIKKRQRDGYKFFVASV